ncbi:hypothetical protein [Komagataeibacter medellinensis]|uniref:Uncharacterized protein n=1 Tax=Komagataeibacter medellinensis (strain NBRC 3288 / BCRC 11682 / LMG 1693 / Kondo 51) TaxID=634177 RepID=G2I752_KOMMN|nr:hypothetical protein [Komagataeibacter medellinensis]BAK83949.1 hypothetical protein GLX_15370 [Komagataeibacter medellinensis NBRC 3288]
MLGISPTRAGISPKASMQARPMSGSTLSEQFQTAVCAEVESRRAHGLKAAFGQVARLFGLTERRVRACWHHEIRRVSADEWELVRARHRQLLQQRHDQLAHEMELIMAAIQDDGGVP